MWNHIPLIHVHKNSVNDLVLCRTAPRKDWEHLSIMGPLGDQVMIKNNVLMPRPVETLVELLVDLKVGCEAMPHRNMIPELEVLTMPDRLWMSEHDSDVPGVPAGFLPAHVAATEYQGLLKSFRDFH